MKLELKSIGYWSLIKISFLINLVVGFVVGLFFAIFVGLFIGLISQFGGMSGMPMLEQDMPPIGFLMIFYPFMFSFGTAFFGTIFYLIIAFVYNLIARFVGGIELDFSEIKPSTIGFQPPQTPPPIQSPPPPPPPPPPVEPMPPEITPPSTDNDQGQL